MNDLESMKTRQIVTKDMEPSISSLHACITFFECLLHISYRLDIKKWFVIKTDRHAMDARKKGTGKISAPNGIFSGCSKLWLWDHK
ncbi:hypothetical protein TNCT_77841 [Trichonephila clavata]|uniref:Uncharacterized protein n=1 Tax=Trichonephila clavata TaxID=2740835 RepID=A0A8X6M4M1_TRICU|nr:hypothetical protein TNCT_77841 [Trichonephila clavata]